jgi:hypothetical protein
VFISCFNIVLWMERVPKLFVEIVRCKGEGKQRSLRGILNVRLECATFAKQRINNNFCSPFSMLARRDQGSQRKWDQFQELYSSMSNRVDRAPAEEVRLYEDSKERNRLEELSDLYAIIKATELLEAAYSRDCISSTEYADACGRYISQFKTAESALISRKYITSTDAFMKEFQIDCPRAYERLVVTGATTTIKLFPNVAAKLYA